MYFILYNVLDCSLRLQNGTHPWEGVLYVRIKNEWRAVCDDRWDLIDAKVACRQLGYADALKSQHGKAVTTPNYWINNLQCSGNENILCDCPSGIVNCGAHEGAYAACACK